MHVNSSRFNLSPADHRGIALFEREIWQNSEVCNHCFTRVRSIERNPEAERLASTSTRNLPAEFHERTEKGTQEHTPFDTNVRFGTCFCTECGGDLRARHRDLDVEMMLEFANNLCRYVRDHTSLTLDANRFAREIGSLKSRRDTQGRETQVFAVAFARALRPQVPFASSGTSSPV